jgi:hypothetical protein
MKNILNEEINKINYLFGYKRGIVISEQSEDLGNAPQDIVAFYNEDKEHRGFGSASNSDNNIRKNKACSNARADLYKKQSVGNQETTTQSGVSILKTKEISAGGGKITYCVVGQVTA